METMLRQFNRALNSLVRGVTAATQAATPIIRLRDALQPLVAARAANETLARLAAAAADSVNASGAQRAALGAAFGSLPLSRDADPSRSSRSTEYLGEKVELAIRRFAKLAPERGRAALDGSREGGGFGLPERSLRRIASVLEEIRVRVGRPTLALQHPIAPATARLLAASWALSRIPAPAPLERVIDAAGASRIPWQRRRADGHPAWSAMAGAPGGLPPTSAYLAPGFELGRARLGSAAPTDSGRSPASEPIARRLPGAPSFPLSDYFDAAAIATPFGAARRLPETRFAQYMQPLTALAHKVVDFASRPARALPRSVAGLSDRPRSFPTEQRWPRLPVALDDSPEAPTRRASLFNMLDRPAPASRIPAAVPAAPSTINVAINVHGVANGDEFVRRHGYEIARVLEQVMERRARRAF